MSNEPSAVVRDLRGILEGEVARLKEVAALGQHGAIKPLDVTRLLDLQERLATLEKAATKEASATEGEVDVSRLSDGQAEVLIWLFQAINGTAGAFYVQPGEPCVVCGRKAK